jgi:hypothetical protein
MNAKKSPCLPCRVGRLGQSDEQLVTFCYLTLILFLCRSLCNQIGERVRAKMSSSSSSPHRSRGGNSSSIEERPRFFDSKAKGRCWANAETVPGRHPERWRKDAAGNIVCKRFCNCQGCLCFEYDHIVPFSKGTHPSLCPLHLFLDCSFTS